LINYDINFLSNKISLKYENNKTMLTKEEVIEIFFKERPMKKEILALADIHNKYLSRVPL